MFNETQLVAIKFAAKNSKNQGELAVLRYFETHPDIGSFNFSETQWNVLKFCAEECKRQHSGEVSVYDMVVACNEAMAYKTGEPDNVLTNNFIEQIGMLVEPIDNAKGFRKVPIGIWDGYTWIEKAKWDRVPELLETLLSSYYEGALGHQEEYSAPINSKIESAEDEFYFEYENIHPFFDGNGRSGKILYNYLKGTLSSPQMPPNFWGSSNP